MTILEEYLKKINENRWGSIELEQELKRLIKIYNEKEILILLFMLQVLTQTYHLL